MDFRDEGGRESIRVTFLTHRSRLHGLPAAGRCRLAWLPWSFHWKVSYFQAGDETEQAPGAPEVCSGENHKTITEPKSSRKTK